MKKITLLAGLLACTSLGNAQVVSTFAGSWGGFYDGTTGLPDRFSSPGSSAIDANGNIYVVDSGNYKIRKITPSGVVTTLAGSTSGYADGSGVAAQFYSPSAVTIDAGGNLYVTDYNKIRKITPSGVVSTLAGSTQGFADGVGTAAQFYNPEGLAIDTSGNIYVADSGNQKIRKITPDGIVSTLAGSTLGFADGVGTSAKFYNPRGVATDASGNLYVADSDNGKIRKITPGGIVSTLAAVFYNPNGVAIDADNNTYVADTDNFKIIKITPDGVVSTLAGSMKGFADGVDIAAQFYSPGNITIDGSGNLYVRDQDRMRKVTPTGVVSTFACFVIGSADGEGSVAQFYTPSGMVTDASGNLYIADSNNNKIRKITPAGIVSTFAGSVYGSADGVGTAAKFKQPSDVTIDASGNVYVADDGNYRIRKITPDGVVSTFAGSEPGFADGVGTAAQFNGPTGVATDVSGNVYVADKYNHKIRKITPNGIVSTLAGSVAGFADGIGTAAQFNSPQGLETDAIGNIYVSDFVNHKIRKITPAGVVTTIAGSTQGYADGMGSAAQFFYPGGLEIDANGNIYVAENQKIRKITPAGVVTTLVGSGRGYVDGDVTIAQFGVPDDVAIDANGNMYVSDSGNDVIRKITAQSLGINDHFQESLTFMAYPNPCRDLLKIKSIGHDGYSYRLCDMTGKQVLNGNYNDIAKSGINTSGLSKGVYILSLMAEGKTQNIKVVKE